MNIQIEVDKKGMEHEFYGKPFYFSYSSLNKLMYAPQLFYRHYILGQREDQTSQALLEGKVIHCLLLDNGSFDEQFLLLPGNMPSDNPKKVIDAVFDLYKVEDMADRPEKTLGDYDQAILDILKAIDLHQSLTDDKKAPMKTGDEKRLEKLITDANKEYFEFLKKQTGKDIVDIPTLEYCTEVANLLKDHSEVNQLLGINSSAEDVQVFNELPIQASLSPGTPFGIKGILDNVVIDLKNKVIRINDLKTTSKSLSEFKETVDFWNLWLQATLYEEMVRQEFLRNNDVVESEWSVEFTFVVIDKYKQIYPFKVSETTKEDWRMRTAKVLEAANWHYKERRYDLPYELAINRVTL